MRKTPKKLRENATGILFLFSAAQTTWLNTEKENFPSQFFSCSHRMHTREKRFSEKWTKFSSEDSLECCGMRQQMLVEDKNSEISHQLVIVRLSDMLSKILMDSVVIQWWSRSLNSAYLEISEQKEPSGLEAESGFTFEMKFAKLWRILFVIEKTCQKCASCKKIHKRSLRL